MPAKLRILFLGMSVGGATFLAAGFAYYVTIAQVQYSTMQARVTQAAQEANQTSTRAKSVPVLANAEAAQEPYELVSVQTLGAGSTPRR